MTFAEEYLKRLKLRYYAANPGAAKRAHGDKKSLNPYRNHYQRDRDRILYSRAFRNLAHKTQVLPYPHCSFIRTRLTHTIEVAQIARTIARALRLNEDLTEAIALGHDLGHAPFGHVGEDMLRELLLDYGGFEHNEHSLRIVEEIEQLPDKPGYRGLNLTDHTRDGILKHTTARDGFLKAILPEDKTNLYRDDRVRAAREKSIRDDPILRPFLFDDDGNLTTLSRTLEGKVVDIADEIAYVTHDVEDTRHALGISGDELIELIPDYIELSGGLNRSKALDSLISGVIAETEKQIKKFERSYDAIEKVDIHHSAQLEECVARVKTFFKEHIYDHTKLKDRATEARSYVKKLCSRWTKNPDSIPSELRGLYPHHADLVALAKSDGTCVKPVCHLIASMTDLEVLDCYNSTFSPTFQILNRPWE